MKIKKYTEMMNYLSTSPYQKQVGGKHYIKYKIQPSEFVVENKLLYPEGSVI